MSIGDTALSMTMYKNKLIHETQYNPVTSQSDFSKN